MGSWKDAPIVGTAAQPQAAQAGTKWQDAPPVDPSKDEWERAVLLPMETNKRTGERRLAMPGFIDAGISAATLPGDVLSGKTNLDPRISYAGQDPETLDRAATLAGGIGAELPLAARGMVAPSARNLVDASGTVMPKLVADELEKANLGAAGVQQGLEKLGPAGVLGDLTPSLQARTGAIATTSGPGQDLVVNAMMGRFKGANDRIKGAVEGAFGPEPVPSQIAGELDAARVNANKAYPPVFAEKALSGATPAEAMFDTKPIFDAIDAQVPNFLGETRSKIQAVRDMLVNPATGELVTDPQMILAARQEIDGMLGALVEQRGNKTTIKALGDMRRMIDDDLARQVPGIKEADAGFAKVAEQGKAFDLGRDVLRGGENPTHPVDLQATVAALKGPDAALRLSQGTLSKIYETIGMTANDRVALKAILKGEGSWNREKLVTVFGEAKAQKLIDLLDAEATMAQTENLVFGNSKTEVIRSAKDGIEPKQSSPGVIRSALNVNIGDAAAKVADALLGGAIKRTTDKRNEAIAKALLSPGGWRQGSKAISNMPGMTPASNIAVLEALIEPAKRGGMLTGGGF